MTNIELLQNALHAAEGAYIYLTPDEKDILNSDYDYYKNLSILRRLTDNVIRDIKEKKQKQKEDTQANEPNKT